MIRFRRTHDKQLIIIISWFGTRYEWLVTRYGLERM